MPVMTDQQQVATLVVEEGVATICMNRPAAFNALDVPMARRLAELAKVVESQRDTRVLVLRGAGKVFCAGGDIDLFVANAGNLDSVISELLNHLNDFLQTLRRMPQFVITRVHGVAAGAGMSLAFMADLCVCTTGSKFRPAYAALGVSPDVGASIGVLQTLGPRRALQLFLLEDQIDARQAQECGLVAQVVEEDELDSAIAAYATRLVGLSSHAVAATKQLFWQSTPEAMKTQLDQELKSILGCMRTKEFLQNIQNFADRRQR